MIFSLKVGGTAGADVTVGARLSLFHGQSGFFLLLLSFCQKPSSAGASGGRRRWLWKAAGGGDEKFSTEHDSRDGGGRVKGEGGVR